MFRKTKISGRIKVQKKKKIKRNKIKRTRVMQNNPQDKMILSKYLIWTIFENKLLNCKRKQQREKNKRRDIH